jgi:CRISPR system Cascade subunit CasE
MSTFNLMHCQPDPRKFLPWASRQGWLPAAGGDIGYALHIALHEVFGDHAPRPFYYRDARAGLLAYSSRTADELREAASLANPELAIALGLDEASGSPGLNVRPFPLRWSAGRVLGFDVRVRPVHRGHDGREFDAYIAAASRQQGPERLLRQAVYAQWLEREFTATGAASIVEARVTRFQLTSVLRRSRPDATTGGARKSRTVHGPDAVFSGHLRVGDPDAFAHLVARGVGRHRAFGFGMLRLRPASMAA